MLGLLLRAGCAIGLFMAWGCSTGGPQHSAMQPPNRPMVRAPAIVTKTTNEPARSAAAEELGPQAVAAIPPAEKPAPKLVDPGAAALIQSMLNRMAGDRQTGPDGITHIGLSQLRNQSRCGGAEFTAFCERFAGLLNHAARDCRPPLQFVTDSKADAQYQLQGAAYLISDQGFDVWELFLSLTPSTQSWTIWEAANPVHVLRDPRPGQPQFLPR